MEFFTGRISDRLELDAAQNEQLQALSKELLDRKSEMRAWHLSIADTIHEEFLKDEMDEETIDSVLSEGKQKIDDMVSFAASRMVAFHKILTPEQRQKLMTAVEEHRESHSRYH